MRLGRKISKFGHSKLFRISDFGFRISLGLSLAFVSPREIRRLNRTYHGEDQVTDVLAFPAGEREEARSTKHETRNKPKTQISKFGHSKLFRISDFGFRISRARPSKVQSYDLGELVVCPSYVKQQAKRAGEPFRRELTRVLVHGTLHLLGHDHATPSDAERMFHMQEQLVRSLNGH
jgi:rRNA maturation RNase YbeY